MPVIDSTGGAVGVGVGAVAGIAASDVGVAAETFGSVVALVIFTPLI